MDEEVSFLERDPVYEPVTVCKCLIDQDSSEAVVISERKRQILTTVTRTESYLKERRIPELVRFLLSKLLAERPNKPVIFLEKLVNDCMLFRAGHGAAPVLYENKYETEILLLFFLALHKYLINTYLKHFRHLEAVVKSFDPGQRGWLSAGQTRRAFITLGLQPDDDLDERISSDEVLNTLRQRQESELFELLSAGMDLPENTESSKSDSSDT
ncbi:unnamed protein product [Diatraea saccharalis]|uniref:Uncharacterized protein n=1 Tax=Diatraea saccharalis TaxID=40085 RepID=A0A9N9RGU6_9NEOP|nr:unnamed protein product [Diatraea saccharalis]